MPPQHVQLWLAAENPSCQGGLQILMPTLPLVDAVHFLFSLLFFSSSRAHFVGLYSCYGDLRGMHCFPTSIAVSSVRLREVAQTLFYTLSLFVRLILNNKAKKSCFFLSVLVLQIRLVSTCLLGRGELCSKLCGCRLWRNNNIAYHLTYNVIHPSLLLQKALRSCF